jgi:hypothetical protein
MDFTKVLERLCAIERAIDDGGDPLAIQTMVVEAGECLLRLQRDLNVVQAEADLLRQCVTNARRSSLFRLSCPCISDAEASEMRSPVEEPGARSRTEDSMRPRFVN